MSAGEQIAELGRRTLAIFDAQDHDRLGEVLAPDVAMTFFGHTVTGIPAVRGILDALYTAIPDQTHEIEHLTAGADDRSAAMQLLISGTHDGGPFPTAYGPLPATGRHVAWRAGTFIEARDGLVTTYTVFLDGGAVVTALGGALVPAPAEVGATEASA